MTLPTFLLAIGLATLFGAAFHIWQGGDARRLVFFLVASWLGFALGHVTGDVVGSCGIVVTDVRDGSPAASRAQATVPL